MPAAKKSTAKKTTTKPRAKSNVKSSITKNKGMNWGVVAVVAGVLALVGIFYVLLSQAGTTVNYKTADGSIVPRRFPGDPNPKVTGKAYWGSSVGGNGDPARHETPAGKSLSIRRTFYGWNSSSMITTAKADIAANRLPHVSIKTPGWNAVASGQYDAELDSMLTRLDALGGPVWFTVHHEPEGGGCKPNCPGPNGEDDAAGPAGWRAMQSKVRQRMNALGTKNIAFMPVLMAWTWDSSSNRKPEDWWVPGIWDAYIVDSYAETPGTNPSDTKAWKGFVPWVESKGLPFGTAEWGMRTVEGGSFSDTPDCNVLKTTTAAQESAAEAKMQAFWDWGFTNKKDLIAHSYFDSCLNSTSGGWALAKSQLTRFQSILKNDTRIQRIKDLGTPTTSTTSPTPTPTTTVSPTTTPTPGTGVTIDFTSPLANAVIKGPVTVTTGPSTNVEEVSFRLDGKWQATDKSAPFEWSWDTITTTNGAHTLTIRARKVGDPGDVYTEKSIDVTVNNPVESPTPTPTSTPTPTPTPTTDTTKPSAPTNVKGSIVFDPLKFSYYTNLTWAASYDNVGVASYEVKRNGSSLGLSGTTSFKDITLQPNTLYNYEVYARDAAGNISPAGTARLTGRCFLVWCWAE